MSNGWLWDAGYVGIVTVWGRIVWRSIEREIFKFLNLNLCDVCRYRISAPCTVKLAPFLVQPQGPQRSIAVSTRQADPNG
jgi:hypothetical protein